MSTRAIIVITGQSIQSHGICTTRLYQHSDGYPTRVLETLANSIQIATKLQQYQSAKFLNSAPLNQELMVGATIASSLKYTGLEAVLDKTYDEAFTPKHLGKQSDLEWIYVVDVEKKTISVYGGVWTGFYPIAAYKKGVVDPVSYVEQLIPACIVQEKKAIKAAMKRIQALGFKLN